jgi:hypothetical protein
MKTTTTESYVANIKALIQAYDNAENAVFALSQEFANLYNGLLVSCNRDDKNIKAGMKGAGLAFLAAKKGDFNTPLLLNALACAGIEADYASAFFNGMVDDKGNRFVSRARVSQVMAELGMSTTRGASIKKNGNAGKPAAPEKTAVEKEFDRIAKLDTAERKALVAMMKKAGMM